MGGPLGAIISSSNSRNLVIYFIDQFWNKAAKRNMIF
jgi:hypothetical protein